MREVERASDIESARGREGASDPLPLPHPAPYLPRIACVELRLHDAQREVGQEQQRDDHLRGVVIVDLARQGAVRITITVCASRAAAKFICVMSL